MTVTGTKRFTSEKGAAEYRGKFRRSFMKRISNRFELLAMRRAVRAGGPAATILDMPCGTGRLIPSLLRTATALTCVDISGPMLRQTVELHGPVVRSGVVRLARGSGFQLPFADASFDASVCWRITHHIPEESERHRLFAELARVSRRFVVMSFSDAGNPKAHRRAKSRKRAGRPDRHVTIGREQLEREARAAGLELRGVFPLFRWLSVVTAALFEVRREPSPAASLRTS